MTIDEAIKHCEEVAEEQEAFSEVHAILKNVYNQNCAEKCRKCAEDHRQLAEWLKELKYARVLLKATHDLLHQCNDSYYVLNVLEQTTVYDGAECDGYCLMEDIEEVMEGWDDN